MFFAPAVLAALIASGAFVVVAIAVLWAFVFGDNTWPSLVYPLVGAGAVLCFLAAAAALLSLAYSLGVKEEARPALNGVHVALSVGSTVLLAALPAAFYLGHSGDFGASGPEAVCSRLCRERGFQISKPSESGPSACICLDADARPAATIPLPAAPKR
jgi:hypothetical protein